MTTIIESQQVRNCCRCGKEFLSGARSYACPACIAPKALPVDPLGKPLSFRERQVVNLVCKAKLNKEIAYELHLSELTVKQYLSRIFAKVGATNRTELAVWALTKQMGAVQ
jgi:DNA-binding NarL/FixJ family response regulator